MAVAVMVMDRSALTRMLLMETAEVFDCNTCGAENSDEALEKLATMPRLDLLVTECEAGDVDVLALAEAARRRFPGVPVLFLGTGAEGGACSRLAPPCGYLRKPFTLAEALARIRGFLD